MDDHLGTGKRLHQIGFDRIAHGVGTEQTHRRIELEVQLDKSVDSSHTGAQIMQIRHVTVPHHNLPNAVPLLLGQFTVHELIVRLPKHMYRT